MAIRYLFKGDIDRAPMYKAEANRLLFQLNLIGNPVGALSSVMRDGTIVQVKKVFGQVVATINTPQNIPARPAEEEKLGWYVSVLNQSSKLMYYKVSDLENGIVRPIGSIKASPLLGKLPIVVTGEENASPEGESRTIVWSTTAWADEAAIETAELTTNSAYYYDEEDEVPTWVLDWQEVTGEFFSVGTTSNSVRLSSHYQLGDPDVSINWYQYERAYTRFETIGVVKTDGLSLRYASYPGGEYEGINLNQIEYYNAETWIESLNDYSDGSTYSQVFRGADSGEGFNFEVEPGVVGLVRGAYYGTEGK